MPVPNHQIQGLKYMCGRDRRPESGRSVAVQLDIVGHMTDKWLSAGSIFFDVGPLHKFRNTLTSIQSYPDDPNDSFYPWVNCGLSLLWWPFDFQGLDIL